jgi:hypothetical protein
MKSTFLNEQQGWFLWRLKRKSEIGKASPEIGLEPVRVIPLASPGCKGRWRRRSPSTITSDIACFDLLALDPFARARADDGLFG